MLLLDEETPVAAVASVEAPGVVEFVGGDRPERRRTTGGPPRSCTPPRMTDQPSAHDIAALLAAHPSRVDGAEMRKWFDAARYPVRSGVHRTGRRAHRAKGPVGTVLAEVGLPGAIRSQQAAYGVHPALLDACFQSVAAHPAVQAAGAAACCCRWVCAGCVPTVPPATPATATPG